MFIINYILKTRFNQSNLPNVEIVDMKNEYRQGNLSPISLRLKECIEERLNKNEQVMLLLNRRGYSYYLECKSCHYVFKCNDCDISLKYHKKDQTANVISVDIKKKFLLSVRYVRILSFLIMEWEHKKLRKN